MLGDGNAPRLGGKIQGTAPEAHLVLQSLLDSGGNLGGIPVDLHDLFQSVYDNDGVRRKNVEQIRWVNLPPGPATITIRAFRITRFPQPYAWVWRLS